MLIAKEINFGLKLKHSNQSVFTESRLQPFLASHTNPTDQIKKMELFWIIFLYIPILVILHMVTKNLLKKLQNLPPSPFLNLPLIGHLYLLKKPLHKTFHALSTKYGAVFTLHLGFRLTLVVNSPSAAAECLSKTNDAVFASRPRLLAGKHLGYNYTSMSWAPYGDHWRNLRRISSIELLSSHRIQSLSQIRIDEVRKMIRQLFRASSGNPDAAIEMRSVVFELMFNSMTRMLLGKRYYGEDEGDAVEAEEFRGITRRMHRIVGKATLDDFIPLISWFRDSEDGYRSLQERRDRFLQNLIEGIRGRRRRSIGADEEAKPLIEVLFSLGEADPEYYTDEMVKSLTAVLLQAGSDTSVITMEWAMALLLNNPPILNKVQTEIDTLIGNKRLINDSDLSILPYLHCVIKETLRLYPAAPLLLPHESTQDCVVGGFHIPRRTMLLINAWGMQNDPRIWEEPTMFKPERFMVTEEGFSEELKHMAFGSGRRRCPGEALAMRMIALGLGSLVQCFDWEGISDDMDEKYGALTSKAQPLLAKCRPRPSLVDLLSQI